MKSVRRLMAKRRSMSLDRNLLPDVVTTDVSMPILDGEQLIGRLRSEPRTASIPIVVVSGNYDAARALQSSGLVEAVVHKPVDPAPLRECIRAVASSPRTPVDKHAAREERRQAATSLLILSSKRHAA
jgi:CheY-like chemotaxis protein